MSNRVGQRFIPERFDVGALVPLNPHLFNAVAPGTMGLILGVDEKPVHDPVMGESYVHSVLVEGFVYRATRSAFPLVVE